MGFAVSAETYDAFMGRFSVPLAPVFLDLVGVGPDDAVLDVGCGPGALTEELLRRTQGSVAAVDPQPVFVDAARDRCPGAVVVVGTAEALPFPDATFDLTLAQLVVHFMRDPVQGFREMGRVTRPGGRTAACVWDHAGGSGPLSVFWRAVAEIDPDAPRASGLPGTRRGHLAELASRAGLTVEVDDVVSVDVGFATFEEWWEPFTGGVGPAGDHVASLSADGVAELRSRCRDLLPRPPFTLSSAAWTVVARVG